MKITRMAISVALLLALTTALHLELAASAQPSTPVKATVSARIEYGYALVFYTLESPQPLTSISFNLTGYTTHLVIALAKVQGSNIVTGKLEGSHVSFYFGNPVQRVNFTFVFRAINTTGDGIHLQIPVLLSPLGFTANVTGSITLSQGISLNSTLGKASGSSVKYDVIAPPGATDVIEGSAPLTWTSISQVTSMNRTILVEPGRVTFIDTIEILGLSNSPSETLSLNLPKNYEFDGAEGVLGPYPRNYWREFNTTDSMLIVINLLSSPQRVGQKTLVKLKYHTNRTDYVDAYLGWGATVEDYSIQVCIRGSLSIPQEYITGEQFKEGLRCYALRKEGALLLANMYPSVPITSVSFNKQTANYQWLILLSASAIIVAGIMAVARLRRPTVEKAKEKVLARPALPREALESLEEKVARREELLLSLLDQLGTLRKRRAGTARIASVIQDYVKRDRTLEAEILKILGQMGDTGRAVANEYTTLASTIRQKLNELERIERDFRVGRLDKKEYKERTEGLENELRSLAQKFREILVRKLQA